MEQERIMLKRAAEGRIFMGFLGGGGSQPAPPPPPPPPQSAAVQILDSAKAKSKSILTRRRQAISGLGSTRTGGYSAGGAQGGQTLMGG